MANLYGVMDMQSGILLKYGVPINIAEDIMEERIKRSSAGLCLSTTQGRSTRRVSSVSR